MLFRLERTILTPNDRLILRVETERDIYLRISDIASTKTLYDNTTGSPLPPGNHIIDLGLPPITPDSASTLAINVMDSIKNAIGVELLAYVVLDTSDMIYFYNENNVLMNSLVSVIVVTDPPLKPNDVLYDNRYGSSVKNIYKKLKDLLPLLYKGYTFTSVKVIVEVFNYENDKKYYLLTEISDIPYANVINITMRPVDKIYIRAVYRLSALPSILPDPLANLILSNINSFIGVSAYLARVISNRLGVDLTINNARIYQEGNVYKIEVEYIQDIAPIIYIIIVSFLGGAIVGLLFSGALERIVSSITSSITAISINSYLSQKAQLISQALQMCTTDTCRSQVLGLLNAPDPNVEKLAEIPQPRKEEKYLYGALGALAGIILARVIK